MNECRASGALYTMYMTHVLVHMQECTCTGVHAREHMHEHTGAACARRGTLIIERFSA